MINLILFALATIGFAHILVDGSIFNPFKSWLGSEKNLASPPNQGRSWKFLIGAYNWFMNIRIFKWLRGKLLSLMSCYQCSGFWAGGIVECLFFIAGEGFLKNNIWCSVFCCACAGAFLSTFAAVVIMWMQAKIDK